MWTVVRAAELRPTPWRNGQGITRDILTVPAADGALLWQVSIADLVQDTDFSDFTGFDRIFTPLANPVELSFDHGPFTPCPVLVPVPFAGERRTRCRLSHGSSRAFNAVWNRSGQVMRVDVLHIPSGGRLGTVAATSVLHCLQGVIAIGDMLLQAGDSSYGPHGLEASAIGQVVAIQASVS